ncbi:MAG TPA: hypothetical protein VH763_09370 [Gemmatimonadales bacterium]|jgi:uncharacterized membrane protein
MNDATLMAILRIIHIVGGVFWVGSALFVAAILMPSMQAVGPSGGQLMEHMVQVRRLPVRLMVAMLLVVLSGIALYWKDSDGFQSAWMRSGPGTVFGLGAIFGIAGAAVGMATSAPAARRLGAVTAAIKARGGPPTAEEQAEIQRLQARMRGAARLVAVLLVLATAAMAVARYVP